MASYRKAITWIVANDDITFLHDEYVQGLSVTASLVADMFGQTDEQVRIDLLSEEARQARASDARKRRLAR